MRVLAIDPAIRNTGYAVLDGDHKQAAALDYGTLSLPQKWQQSANSHLTAVDDCDTVAKFLYVAHLVA